MEIDKEKLIKSINKLIKVIDRLKVKKPKK
jgi:hypothetical protein